MMSLIINEGEINSCWHFCVVLLDY